MPSDASVQQIHACIMIIIMFIVIIDHICLGRLLYLMCYPMLSYEYDCFVVVLELDTIRL